MQCTQEKMRVLKQKRRRHFFFTGFSPSKAGRKSGLIMWKSLHQHRWGCEKVPDTYICTAPTVTWPLEMSESGLSLNVWRMFGNLAWSPRSKCFLSTLQLETFPDLSSVDVSGICFWASWGVQGICDHRIRVASQLLQGHCDLLQRLLRFLIHKRHVVMSSLLGRFFVKNSFLATKSDLSHGKP